MRLLNRLREAATGLFSPRQPKSVVVAPYSQDAINILISKRDWAGLNALGENALGTAKTPSGKYEKPDQCPWHEYTLSLFMVARDLVCAGRMDDFHHLVSIPVVWDAHPIHWDTHQHKNSLELIQFAFVDAVSHDNEFWSGLGPRIAKFRHDPSAKALRAAIDFAAEQDFQKGPLAEHLIWYTRNVVINCSKEEYRKREQPFAGILQQAISRLGVTDNMVAQVKEQAALGRETDIARMRVLFSSPEAQRLLEALDNPAQPTGQRQYTYPRDTPPLRLSEAAPA